MTATPDVQWIERIEDIDAIVFTDGVAALMVNAKLLSRIGFKNDERGDSPRLHSLMQSIRDHGYRPRDPVIARIGQRGRWVVVDGGHRLTALRLLREEFLFHFFGPKLGHVYFLLFTTRSSWRKLRRVIPDLPLSAPAEVFAPEARDAATATDETRP